MEALGDNYGHGEIVALHCHAEDQLIYAASGVMQVSSDQGNWVIPSGHALWVPAAVGHEIRMIGDVCVRTLLIRPIGGERSPARCQVIEVSGLLRELILAAARLLNEHGDPRDHHVRALIRMELDSARRVDSHIPIPRHPRLRALCERFLDDPAQELTLEQCGAQLNMSSRTIARLFQRELAMSYGEWRTHTRMILSQQCLAGGMPILTVALEHGYQSASAFAAMFKRTLGYTPRDWQMSAVSPADTVQVH